MGVVVTMLEKPDIPDETIITCLQENYSLPVVQLTFLPLGADQNTVVYRVLTSHAAEYFVKLRRGEFDEMPILIPKFLHDQGIPHIIAPLPTQANQLWTALDDYLVTVFPFFAGHTGDDAPLTDAHWRALGQALKAIHSTALPDHFIYRMQKEAYAPQWRERVTAFQRRINEQTFSDPIAAELAALLQKNQSAVNRLVNRAAALAAVLQTQTQTFVLCHADIHVWNMLIDAHDRLHIVDWDTLLLAPKERDLMFMGSGIGGVYEAEEALFYQGYGPTAIDPVALSYYRHERIVVDIAEYCDQILLTTGDSQDRAAGLRAMQSQFGPRSVTDIAFQTDKKLPPEYRAE